MSPGPGRGRRSVEREPLLDRRALVGCGGPVSVEPEGARETGLGLGGLCRSHVAGDGGGARQRAGEAVAVVPHRRPGDAVPPSVHPLLLRLGAEAASRIFFLRGPHCRGHRRGRGRVAGPGRGSALPPRLSPVRCGALC